MGAADAKTSILLARWHGGEREALDALLDRHLETIRAQVHRRLGPMLRERADSGDFVHDAVVEVLRYGPRFFVTSDAVFRAVLARIVENVLRDKHDWFTARRRAVANERPLPSDTVLSLDAPRAERESPSQEAGRHEREAWVRLGLELLAPDDREAIVLHEWEGLPFARIGEQLGMTESGARMRYHRSLVRLGECIGELRRGGAARLVAEALP